MKGLLSSNGNTSSMRIMALLCVITSCLIAILGIVLNRELGGIAAVIGALLMPAFAGKWLQAKEELRHEEVVFEEQDNTIR